MTHTVFFIEQYQSKFSCIFLSLKSLSLPPSVFFQKLKSSPSHYIKQAIPLPLDLSILSWPRPHEFEGGKGKEGVWGAVSHLILRVAIRVLKCSLSSPKDNSSADLKI